MEMNAGHDPATGKPLDETYLEKGLPPFLQRDLDAYKNEDGPWDCLWCELYGSINSALYSNEISNEQAVYLRRTYLFGEEEDE
jgi:hypothetical protein